MAPPGLVCQLICGSEPHGDDPCSFSLPIDQHHHPHDMSQVQVVKLRHKAVLGWMVGEQTACAIAADCSNVDRQIEARRENVLKCGLDLFDGVTHRLTQPHARLR